MLEASLVDLNQKITANIAQLSLADSKFNSTYFPYESRCLNLDREFIGNHSSNPLRIAFGAQMPTNPKIVVSVNGILANIDLDISPAFNYSFGIRRIADSDIFPTHFILNFLTPPSTTPAKSGAITLQGLDVCYLAYLP